MVIDKIIPSGIIEKRLDMLKKETPEALLSPIKINSLFKFILLFFIVWGNVGRRYGNYWNL